MNTSIVVAIPDVKTRLISDRINDTDREWLVFLDDAFANTDAKKLTKAGVPPAAARALIDALALRERYNKGNTTLDDLI